MKKVAQQLTPQLNPIADAYATDYYDAEGFYDSLPKNIKEKIMTQQAQELQINRRTNEV